MLGADTPRSFRRGDEHAHKNGMMSYAESPRLVSTSRPGKDLRCSWRLTPDADGPGAVPLRLASASRWTLQHFRKRRRRRRWKLLVESKASRNSVARAAAWSLIVSRQGAWRLRLCVRGSEMNSTDISCLRSNWPQWWLPLPKSEPAPVSPGNSAHRKAYGASGTDGWTSCPGTVKIDPAPDRHPPPRFRQLLAEQKGPPGTG